MIVNDNHYQEHPSIVIRHVVQQQKIVNDKYIYAHRWVHIVFFLVAQYS